jgi:hypothetical protein
MYLKVRWAGSEREEGTFACVVEFMSWLSAVLQGRALAEEASASSKQFTAALGRVAWEKMM